jgi:hypothetical protein
VGITHTRHWASDEDEDEDEMGNEVTVTETVTIAFTSLTLEAMLVATPAPNVAIVFGPYLDLGLGGGSESETTPDVDPTEITTENDLTYTSYGVSAGIALVF